MKKIYLSITILQLILFLGCSNSITSNEDENSSWIFVANEGNPCFEQYGDDCSNAGDGSITMIDNNGEVKHHTNIGYIVNSLKVHNNNLYVIVNQDHKILKYNIDSKDIYLDSIIETNNSSPREMIIIDNLLYFSNWDTQDIKILNLETNILETNTISIDGRPEDIIFDGTYIWVSIPELNQYDGNKGTKVGKINPSNNVVEYLDVGRGPQDLEFLNNEIYVSRTFYSPAWDTTYHGISKISSETINQKTYYQYSEFQGTPINIDGAACGASILSYQNKIYRQYDGGIAMIGENLNIDILSRVGNYIQNQIYHVEILNGNIWFGIYDTINSIGYAKSTDSNGNEIASYRTGIFPSDFDYWQKLD